MPVTWSDWLNMSAPLEPKDATVKRCVKADRTSEHSWHTTYCHDTYWALCGDSGLYFNLSVMSYTEAKAACGAQGSVVAKIENQEQLDALADVLDNISTSGLLWLGMEFNDTGHVFMDGSEVTWFKWATLDFREPDDLSWKHCVVYDHEYRGWKARQCTNPAPVICQEKKVTPNYKLLNTDVDLVLTPSSTIETNVPNKCAITCYDQSCTHFTLNGAECRLYAATGVPTQTPLVGATLWIEDEQD
ncbi:C-type mannose receptor 2-like [Haliotis rufescens]|uniref:C-type mannose receptor 2-like n=1 Tax=Haliotis rufescens TaxID=6454 RepID=UPI00201E8C4C|nr:C-type mannose receptor 2-like [Haliotis rufescens]